ncbi:MAG: hypothetical protein R3F65_05630 [bacterium]
MPSAPPSRCSGSGAGAEVAGVAGAVAVGVGLVFVEGAAAVVAGVAAPSSSRSRWSCGWARRAVVAGVADVVGVEVALLGGRWRGADIADVAMAVAVAVVLRSGVIVQLSQASPWPSRSRSGCAGSGMAGQTSQRLWIWSVSGSTRDVVVPGAVMDALLHRACHEAGDLAGVLGAGEFKRGC